MKALETLKEFQKDIRAYLNSFDEDNIRDEDYLSASLTAVKIDDAIKELEEINDRFNNLANCKNCKHSDKSPLDEPCSKCRLGNGTNFEAKGE